MVLLTIAFLQFYKEKDNKIVIGAVIPETGFGVYWGQAVRKGVSLAETDLKQKYGEDIKIIVEDSQSDIKIGVNATKKLLQIDRADAIYSEFSGVSSAISPIVKKNNKILVYSTFNQKIADDNPLSIKTFISYEVVCKKFADTIQESSRILILSTIGDASQYCKKGLQSKIPEKNIEVIDGFTGKDFRTILLKAKQEKTDFILPIMYEDGAYALIKQKYELKIPVKLFCYKQDCVTEKLLNELPKDSTNGLIYFEIPLDEKFIERVKKDYPDVSSGDLQAIANTYQSIMSLGDALENCYGKENECSINFLKNKKLTSSGYKNSYFRERILMSEINIAIVGEN